MLEGLSMRLRLLMGSMLRRVARAAGITSGGGASGFELMLAPSREDPGRYAIESVRKIDRRAALKALRTFGLVSTPSLVPPGCFRGRE